MAKKRKRGGSKKVKINITGRGNMSTTPASDKPRSKGATKKKSGAGSRGPSRGDKRSGPVFSLKKAVSSTHKAFATWRQEAEALAHRVVPAGDTLKLDPWQQEAFDFLTQGDSVIVDAPTTAGKTRVVEAFFAQNIHLPNFRAAYTTPVKSLSNDKLKEFRAMFGAHNVGIATGDIKENLNAPIVVSTLETYRNSLLGTEPDLGRNLVVFDEYHYMQDTSRGSAWEEALILTPNSCQVLLLSASVKNSDEFCGWLGKIRGTSCHMVKAGHRPVPLVDLVYFREQWLLVSEVKALKRQHLDHRLLRMPLHPGELAKSLPSLVELDLVPCIVYAGRRLACEKLASEIARAMPRLAPAQSSAIEKALAESQGEFGSLDFMPAKLLRMILDYGVAFHHSGMAPPLRLGVEKLVKDGLLRFCVATMGLSLGINFSVRSALISDYTRPDEAGFVDYRPSEILQMLGRAGRRGRDVVGYSLWPNFESLSRLDKRHRDDCDSRLRNDPTTFLGLVGRGYSTGLIERFYERSFRRHQDKNVNLSLINRDHLKQALQAKELPCQSAARQYSLFAFDNPSALCHSCSFRPRCHPWIDRRRQSDLARLQLHLHSIGALDDQDGLTRYGDIARFIPQNGGLLIAGYLATGRIKQENLLAATELMGALALARFKEPGCSPRYKFPFDAEAIEKQLEDLYPFELFPEIYDKPYGQRDYPIIRELNPAVGYAIRSWQQGMDWDQLVREVVSDSFGVGDLMGLLYRVATYLQSIGQTGMPEVGPAARMLRESILREPLAFAIEPAS